VIRFPKPGKSLPGDPHRTVPDRLRALLGHDGLPGAEARPRVRHLPEGDEPATPLRKRTPADHLAAFRAAFGPDLARMDKAIATHLSKLRYDPLPYYAVLFEQRVGGNLERACADMFCASVGLPTTYGISIFGWFLALCRVVDIIAIVLTASGIFAERFLQPPF
jgi:hypothetical protein